MSSQESPFPAPSTSSSFIGRKLGDFTIRAEIGRGGMGTVFIAHQKSLDRQVALKVLHAGPGMTESAVIRFKREAQAAGRLTHRNIVPIFGQGQQDDTYYYAMELVQGRSLIRIIEEERGSSQAATDADETVVLGSPGSSDSDRRSGSGDAMAETALASPDDTARLPSPAGSAVRLEGESRFDRIAELMASVADALEYAHRNGVIHRDIKPHNLMLSDDGRLCITDFGLARVLSEPGVTVTGEFIGSPRYMSPEQISGTSGRVDHRSDIYSLGTTLYEWLALRPPFPGETREQVIAQIMTIEPIAPRVHDPRIPLDLETICQKAIEKDPAHRYQSAGQMRDDLLRFSQRHAIHAKRAGLLGRVRKFIARHHVTSLAIGAGMIAVALTSALVFERSVSTKEQRGLAKNIQSLEAEKSELKKQVERFQDLEGLLQAGIGLGKGLPLPSLGLRDSAQAGAPMSLASPAERHFVDHLVPVLLDDFLQRTAKGDRQGRRAGRLAGYRKALQDGDHERAWKLLRPRLEGDLEDNVALELRAVLACERGQFRRMLLDAERMIKREPTVLQGYWLRALALVLGSRVTEALEDLDFLTDSGWRDAWILTAQGAAFARQQAWEKALSNFEAAVALSPNHTSALVFRAEVLARQGKHETAILDLHEVIRIEPQDYLAFAMRGQYFQVLGRYGSAADDLKQAFDLNPTIESFTKMMTAQARRPGAAASVPASAESEQGMSTTPAIAPETGFDRPPDPSPIGRP